MYDIPDDRYYVAIPNVTIDNSSAVLPQLSIGPCKNFPSIQWKDADIVQAFGFVDYFQSESSLLEFSLQPQQQESPESDKEIGSTLNVVLGLIAFLGAERPWYPFSLSRNGINRFSSAFDPHDPPRQIHLSLADVQVLARQTMILRESSSVAGRVRLALSRHLLSFERDIFEDAVLDLWIGLEALFFERGESLSFRGCSAIADFLSTKESRVRIFRIAKQSYDVRSRIVHGDKVDMQVLAQMEGTTRGLLREALQKILAFPSLSKFESHHVRQSAARGLRG
jgi:hypothetical protein